MWVSMKKKNWLQWGKAEKIYNFHLLFHLKWLWCQAIRPICQCFWLHRKQTRKSPELRICIIVGTLLMTIMKLYVRSILELREMARLGHFSKWLHFLVNICCCCISVINKYQGILFKEAPDGSEYQKMGFYLANHTDFLTDGKIPLEMLHKVNK